MKRVLFCLFVFAIAISMPSQALAQNCAKIKDGTILASNGVPVVLGYDEAGYNYQAGLFNGTYDSVDRVLDGKYYGQVVDFANDSLIMKWSSDWLASVDCNRDGKLDRGLDPKTGIVPGISKGWTTNHAEGDYLGADGDYHHYTYFVKIVWVGPKPAGTDPWAGVRLWDQYAIIEEVYNDPYGGYHGVDRTRLAHPAGFGAYK